MERKELIELAVKHGQQGTHLNIPCDKWPGCHEDRMNSFMDGFKAAEKHHTVPISGIASSIAAKILRESKKRYFIVFASGDRKTTACFHITTDGGYITLDDIDKAYNEQFEGTKEITLVPTNIIELNESDYKDWIK